MLAVVVFPLHNKAQERSTAAFEMESGQTSAVELGFNYTYIRANAPPAACGGFSMNGGGGNLVVNMPHGLSLVADLDATHASKINGTTQSITVFNYLVGPRYSYRTSSRFTPYVQVLLGGSEELSNDAFVQNSNAFAVSGGGRCQQGADSASRVEHRRGGLYLFAITQCRQRSPERSSREHGDHVAIRSSIANLLLKRVLA
jgi:hypothetical protein